MARVGQHAHIHVARVLALQCVLMLSGDEVHGKSARKRRFMRLKTDTHTRGLGSVCCQGLERCTKHQRITARTHES